jgi:hypothetical protein
MLITMIKRLLMWTVLCGVEVYLCLTVLPSVARNLPAGRGPFLLVAYLLTAALAGYLLVRGSQSQDCWQSGLLFGGLVYGAIVLFILVLHHVILLPAPPMFVLSGAALGGLLRWHQNGNRQNRSALVDTT